MVEPRKHHYLPQFYLRGFSQDGRSLFQIDKTSGYSCLCSIRDTAAIRDYHALDYSDVEDPYALEKSLSKTEEHLSHALCHVIEGGISSQQIHTAIVEFASLIRCRVPAVKSYIEESLRQMVRSAGMIMEQSGKLPPPPKGYEDVLRMDRVSISILNWKCLEFMFRLASSPKVLGILGSMSPSICRTYEDYPFLTSDQPVAVYHPEALPTDLLGTGFTDPRSEVSLPLSNQVLLHLTWDTSRPKERWLDPTDVEEFNRRTITMASSLVFAPKQSQAAADTVTRYCHCFAGVDVEVLNVGDRYLHVLRSRPVMRPERYADSDSAQADAKKPQTPCNGEQTAMSP